MIMLFDQKYKFSKERKTNVHLSTKLFISASNKHQKGFLEIYHITYANKRKFSEQKHSRSEMS